MPAATAGIAIALLDRVPNSTAADSVSSRFRATRAEAHPHCYVCSDSNPMGLSLRYTAQPDGSVRASFPGHTALEGYPGLMHGGVIAALLDGAMTNCLFAHHQRALTAELKVRYHMEVKAAEEVILRAWLEDCCHGLFRMQAELIQGGRVKASASARFIRKP
jgi:acyl-coenzyme A thioesterase PaaI-like protein